jgi:Transposase zinc-binding domain
MARLPASLDRMRVIREMARRHVSCAARLPSLPCRTFTSAAADGKANDRPHFVFRAHGAAWREANAGHVSLDQLKVMSAIETCRTAALGGHVERCEDCAHERISYNSCRNRHCPKCQAAAARQWLEDREAELLLVPYYHVVFTLPAALGAVAFQNKAAVYDLLFRTAAKHRPRSPPTRSIWTRASA